MAPIEDQRKGWHLVKEIPLALLFGLGLQTVGALWWAASITARVEANERAALVALSSQAALDARQDAEVTRSEARMLAQMQAITVKLDRLIERK